MNILLIDDDPDVRFLLARFLKKRGYTVTEFDDAFFACEFLAQGGKAELIITDTQMPKMDGFSFVRRLKEEYPHIKLVMMTASPTPHWLERCKTLKADYCMMQDKTEKGLLAALEHLQSRK